MIDFTRKKVILTRLFVVPFVFGLSAFFVACAQGEKEEESKVKSKGLVGTSCTSRPEVRNPEGLNVCIVPESNWPSLERGQFWYGPLALAFAKQAAIKACEDANALDYGPEFGKSCFKACVEVTHCVPLTPNPDV